MPFVKAEKRCLRRRTGAGRSGGCSTGWRRSSSAAAPCRAIALITDISDGGVRLHVEGFEVPDEFVLLLAGDEYAAKERVYQVVWRLGY